VEFFRGGPALPSLKGIADQAVLVVDARVDSVAKAVDGGLGRTMTNATLTATDVLKGPATKQFSAATINQETVFEMKPGQRFILFLGKGSEFLRNALPDRPNAPQFAVNNALCVENGMVRRPGQGAGPFAIFDNMTPEKALAEIRMALRPN
jgi:hypothetical protein